MASSIDGVPLIPVGDCELGAKGDSHSDLEDDFAYRNNVLQAPKMIRLAFIRKVYSLLTMQLLLTVAVASICMFTPPIKTFVQKNDWMMIMALFGSIGCLIALFIKRRTYPANLILLAAFTVVQAYTVGVLVTFYSKMVVLEALILTVTVLGALTLFTFQTKRDFSTLYSVLFAGLCILVVGGFMQIFLQSSVLELILGLGGAFLFCIFIVVDTQAIMRHLSPEEYILATINLYMDIINLFVYILRILQELNRQ